MIRVVTKDPEVEVDYNVDTLDELNRLTTIIYKPLLKSKYVIQFNTTSVDELNILFSNEGMYSHYDLIVVTNKQILRIMKLNKPNNSSLDEISIWDYMNNGIKERRLLFKKDVIYPLYQSVPKVYKLVDDTLDLILDTYGSVNEISKEMVSEILPLVDIIYPRTVLLSYLRFDKYREYKLNRCIEQIGSDIVLNATIKQIKTLHKQKSKFLSGNIDPSMVDINTTNLNILYYIFVSKKCFNIRDVRVLYKIYEKGLYKYVI